MRFLDSSIVVENISDKATAHICASALNASVQGRKPRVVYSVLVGARACEGELSIVRFEFEEDDQRPG